MLDNVSDVIEPGVTPWGPVAGFDSIWLSIAIDGVSHVARIDPATGSMTATISLDALPAAPGANSPVAVVAIGRDGVWASGWRGTDAASAKGVIVLIDPDTNAIVRTIETSIRPRALAIDDEGTTVWASARFEGRVVRINAETGTVLASFDISFADQIEIVPGAIWVASSDEYGTLTRIDLETNTIVDRIVNGPVFAPGMHYDAGSLWISNMSSDLVGEVLRLNPDTGEVIARIPLTSPGDIAIDERGIWVISASAREVAQIDPKTNQIVARYTGGPPDLWGIAAGYDAIWVSNVIDGTLTRIDP